MRVAFSALLERPQRGDSLVKLVNNVLMALLVVISKHVSKPTNLLHLIQRMAHKCMKLWGTVWLRPNTFQSLLTSTSASSSIV
jgi:hypothetical protein